MLARCHSFDGEPIHLLWCARTGRGQKPKFGCGFEGYAEPHVNLARRNGHIPMSIKAWEGSGRAKRPVWLFSLDTEQFAAVPMTTGRLKAYFQKFGKTAEQTQVDIIHFFEEAEVLA